MITLTLDEAKNLKWGTYGKDGEGQLKVVTLDDCDSDHLKNIVTHLYESGRGDTCYDYVVACKMILESRKVKLPDELFEMD